MPGATPKKGYPYPTGAEAPQGPASFQALAEAIETAFPWKCEVGVISVPVSAASSAVIALEWATITTGTNVFVQTTSRNSAYVATHGTPYTGPPAGTTVAVRHIDGTSATVTVEVEYLAIQVL